MQQVSATQDSNPVICHTWTHEGQLVKNAGECHTKHQWEAIRRDQQQVIENYQNGALVLPLH